MQSLPLSLGFTNGSEPALLASNPASWAASNPLSIEGEGWGRQSGVVGAGKDEVRRDSRRGKKKKKGDSSSVHPNRDQCQSQPVFLRSPYSRFAETDHRRLACVWRFPVADLFTVIASSSQMNESKLKKKNTERSWRRNMPVSKGCCERLPYISRKGLVGMGVVQEKSQYISLTLHSAQFLLKGQACTTIVIF